MLKLCKGVARLNSCRGSSTVMCKFSNVYKSFSLTTPPSSLSPSRMASPRISLQADIAWGSPWGSVWKSECYNNDWILMFIMKCLKEVLISHPSPIALAKKHDNVFLPQERKSGNSQPSGLCIRHRKTRKKSGGKSNGHGLKEGLSYSLTASNGMRWLQPMRKHYVWLSKYKKGKPTVI